MQTREAVRSGRRANFFITENRFIDCYAAKVRGSGVAVYSILQRCANSATRETWISADKMAEVLDIDRSTVYRKLKELEDLRLIKSMRTRDKKIYVVLPVPPPRPEAARIPLFDAIDRETVDQDSTWAPVAPEQTSRSGETYSHDCNSSVASVTQPVPSVRRSSRISGNRNKEEQDFLNKTQEQDLFNKTFEQENAERKQSAKRIINILKLSDTFISAAMAAVDLKASRTKLSMDGIVQEIVTEANHSERRGISNENFLEDFLARASAQQILEDINLPVINNLIVTVGAAVKAEAKDTKLSLEQAATLITNAAIDDRRRGITIDIFYFQNAKWRSHGRTGKGQQQFERIKRARDEAHAIIDAEMDN
jgi:hypothetical protein